MAPVTVVAVVLSVVLALQALPAPDDRTTERPSLKRPAKRVLEFSTSLKIPRLTPAGELDDDDVLVTAIFPPKRPPVGIYKKSAIPHNVEFINLSPDKTMVIPWPEEQVTEVNGIRCLVMPVSPRLFFASR